MKIFNAYIDGAAKGNPGPAGVGIVLYQGVEKVNSISKFIGHTTNNAAEYQALIFAMKDLLRKDAKKLRVFSDSQLLVHQVNGLYKIKSANLKPLFEEIEYLKNKFEIFEIKYIPRENNREADKLASLAIRGNKIADG